MCVSVRGARARAYIILFLEAMIQNSEFTRVYGT